MITLQQFFKDQIKVSTVEFRTAPPHSYNIIFQQRRLLGENAREGRSLLLQDVPLYPGAHTHVPSSGEQDPPFWQEQLNEQLGPQKPCGHTLSQWIPAGKITMTNIQ